MRTRRHETGGKEKGERRQRKGERDKRGDREREETDEGREKTGQMDRNRRQKK